MADMTGSRLGADDEDGRGHRHQPRRPHLPRGHRQPRARRAVCRRHGTATAVLRDGQSITVSCAEGEEGIVYEGTVPFDREEIDLGAPAPAAHQGHAERRQSGAGVSLCRCCPTTASAWRAWSSSSPARIRVHPMALIRFDALPDGPDKKQIAQLTQHYPIQARLLRRAAGRGGRADRRRVLSQGRHRPAVGLQDQRVRRPARR